MFDFPRQPTRLHHFLGENAEGLQNAALMLGGRPWLRRVQRLLDDALNPPSVTRRVISELHQLRALLRLEHVHDLERPEAAYFAELDPAAPYVEEICLLADALDDNLETEASSGQTAPSFDQAVQS